MWKTKWQQSHFKVLNSSCALLSLQKALFFFNDFVTFSRCLNIHALFFFILFRNTFLSKPKSRCCKSTIIQDELPQAEEASLFPYGCLEMVPPCSWVGRSDTGQLGCQSECSVQVVNRRQSLVPGFLTNWPVLCEAAGRSHCPAGAHQTGPLSCRLDTGGWMPTENSNMPFITYAKTEGHEFLYNMCA